VLSAPLGPFEAQLRPGRIVHAMTRGQRGRALAKAKLVIAVLIVIAHQLGLDIPAAADGA
jgi:hypothetical protein